MARRTELLREIREAAALAGVTMEFVRHGSRHDIWRVGSLQFSVPRHRELGERLVRAIRESIEAELGEGWWR